MVTPGPSTLSSEAIERIASVPFGAELLPGARNAIRTCLGVNAGDEVTLVVESETGQTEMGAALLAAAREVTDKIHAYLLVAEHARVERLVQRILARLADSDASVLVSTVTGLPHEFRRRVVDAGGARRRHAHMLGLTPATLAQGMRADYEEVARLGQRLEERLLRTSTIEVRTVVGTDLRVRLDPKLRWHHESGILRAPGWINLPSGEIATTPADVDGVLVPDGGVWSGADGEVPRASRLKLSIRGGRLVQIDGRDDDARAAIEAIVDRDPNGRRVGQFGFGTNLAVLTPVGSLLQDQKMPGVHVGLGHPFGGLTGATWSSTVELPLLVRRPDVMLDGVPVMVRGKYIAELTA